MSPKRLARPLAFACVLFSLFLLPGQVEADQVISDDLVVQGEICSGFDCVFGQDLSFATYTARENNTRIYFDDTSSSGSFPRYDWVLVANDTTNGGRNRFSIENVTDGTEPFTVLGDARDFSIYATATGVGLGTNAPMTDIHVSSSDTPVARLEQTGDAGWAPYTWDLGGNEAGFFVRDTTGNTLPLRVLPGAPDDALVVTESGDLTIVGTLSQGSSSLIKRDIRSIDPHEVLAKVRALPLAEWRYRADTRGTTHLGPMAEDFHDQFGLGPDRAHIAASDVAGVATAAAQALSQIVDSQAQRIDALEKENAALSARLDRIEQLLLEKR